MADTFTWGSGGNKLTASDRRRRMAEAMLKAGTDYSPVQHWTQGLARVANALVGGWQLREADAADAAGAADIAAKFGQLTGALSGGPSAASMAAPASASVPDAASAASIAPVTAPADLLPRFAQAEAQYGLPRNFLAQTAKIESGFNPSAANPNSSARGLFQFVKGTAKDYGLANPMDPIASTDAAARLAADNKATLMRVLGREPTAGELYLAHQQGGGGASKLLANPNARAVDIVGADAVRLNGGNPNMTAGEFARRWTSRLAANEADMPAPGAMPAEAPLAPAGFAIPPGASAPPAMSGDTFNAIQNGQPLDPVFQAEGVSQPWMGTALEPAQPQIAQAPMPPPRPADLAMPQADMPAPGAAPAIGQMPAAVAPVIDPNSPDAGVRAKIAAEAQGTSASPFAGIVQALSGGNGAVAPSSVSPAVQSVARAMVPPQASETPAAVPPQGGDRTALAMSILNSPYAQPGQRAVAQAIVQQAFKDPAETEMKRLQLDKARREAEAAPLDLEGRRLDIEGKRKNLGKTEAPNVQRIKQPDGSEVAVQWDQASGQWVPLKAPEGGNAVRGAPKLTEAQSKDVGFYNRGSKIIDRLEQQDVALKDTFSALGGNVSNFLKSDAYRNAEQTGRELLAVILRKDTGAAVTPQEMELYGNMYLPKPGDDDRTIAQKRQSRRTAIEGLKMGLGTAEILFNSQNAPPPDAATPPAPATADRAALEAEARRRGLIK